MKNDLTATKHELLKIRDMLEMAEKVRFFLQFYKHLSEANGAMVNILKFQTFFSFYI